MTTKPTNWKNISHGTSVLFRRDENSNPEEGTWVGISCRLRAAAAFYWFVYDGVSNTLVQDVGALITENGEWHIDPFWCKLKTEVVAEEENQQPLTLSREHAQALSLLVTERLSALELTKFEAKHGIKHWYPKCVDDTEEGREAYQEYNRLQNLRRSTNAKLKKWRKIKSAIQAITK